MAERWRRMAVAVGALGWLVLLLPVGLVGAQPAKPVTPAPQCGAGPVTVKMIASAPCPDRCRQEIVPTGQVGLYQRVAFCHDLPCVQQEDQQWSDWPECGGKPVTAGAGIPLAAAAPTTPAAPAAPAAPTAAAPAPAGTAPALD